jgi:hypothetical protein
MESCGFLEVLLRLKDSHWPRPTETGSYREFRFLVSHYQELVFTLCSSF